MNVLLLVVAGTVLPAIVSFLKKENWSKKIKMFLSIAASFVVTAGVLAVQGDFSSIHNFLAQTSTVWATSQVVYGMYFDSTTFNAWLESIGIK